MLKCDDMIGQSYLIGLIEPSLRVVRVQGLGRANAVFTEQLTTKPMGSFLPLYVCAHSEPVACCLGNEPGAVSEAEFVGFVEESIRTAHCQIASQASRT